MTSGSKTARKRLKGPKRQYLEENRRFGRGRSQPCQYVDGRKRVRSVEKRQQVTGNRRAFSFQRSALGETLRLWRRSPHRRKQVAVGEADAAVWRPLGRKHVAIHSSRRGGSLITVVESPGSDVEGQGAHADSVGTRTPRSLPSTCSLLLAPRVQDRGEGDSGTGRAARNGPALTGFGLNPNRCP